MLGLSREHYKKTARKLIRSVAVGTAIGKVAIPAIMFVSSSMGTAINIRNAIQENAQASRFDGYEAADYVLKSMNRSETGGTIKARIYDMPSRIVAKHYLNKYLRN